MSKFDASGRNAQVLTAGCEEIQARAQCPTSVWDNKKTGHMPPSDFQKLLVHSIKDLV